MSQVELPGHNPALAPGMTQPIEAGTTYEIEDESGQNLVIEGREHPATLDFINEFDNWLTIDHALPDSARDVRDAAWASVLAKWESLPNHVREQLPSIKAGGVIVPGHSH